MALSKQARITRARMGGYAAASKRDSAAIAAKATAASPAGNLRRFLDEVDPKRELPEKERVRRAEAARHLYYVKLGYLSGKARAEKERLAPWRAADAGLPVDGDARDATQDADDGQDNGPDPWLDGRYVQK